MRSTSTSSNERTDASRAFLLSAPLGLIAAGVLLLATGSDSLTSSWSPRTLVLVHLGTLGFLTVGLQGALYRWIPLQGGAPAVRAAHAVLALLWVGLALLAGGLLTGASRAVFYALTVLAISLVLFLYSLGRSFWKTSDGSEAVAGRKLAVVSLLLVAFLGLWMAHGHSGMRFPGPRTLWIQVHMSVGFLGWVGCSLAVTGWELLPARTGSPPAGRRGRRAVLALVAAGVALPVLVLFLDLAGALPSGVEPAWLALVGAAPAAAAIWLLQPLLTLRGRTQRRLGAGVPGAWLWQVGHWAGPVVAAAALAAYLHPDPRWDLLLGWLAIWAWAGAILHAWLRDVATGPGRESHELGAAGDVGSILHVAAAVTGIAAIASGNSWLARATGLLLVAVGLLLMRSIARLPHAPSTEALPLR